MFNSVYEVRIEGRDLKRFIKTLYRKKIDLLEIIYDQDGVCIKLNKKDYLKLLEIKTIYEIKLTRLYGVAKYKYLLKKYSIFIISILIGFCFLFFLTNVIFEVEVIHRKQDIRNLIYKELKRYKVEKYNFVIPFSKQESIVKKILENNKDKLEWLEIERVGVKYIIRVEERIINDITNNDEPRNVVAKKDGIIMHVDASRGEIVKRTNEYVKKGDIIISGSITKGEEVKNKVAAEGNVYAEVWYTVNVEMPLVYREEYLTGKNKNALTFTLFRKEISILDLFPYKNKRIKENIIFKNNILPIKLSFNKESELRVIDEVYTYDEAIDKALDLAREKLSVKFNDEEKILMEKKLKTRQNNSTIIVSVFFKVYEDITSYAKIEEINNNG